MSVVSSATLRRSKKITLSNRSLSSLRERRSKLVRRENVLHRSAHEHTGIDEIPENKGMSFSRRGENRSSTLDQCYHPLLQ